ncbi:hypothetical protein ACXKGW_28855, partial [Klebsiella pneumoniae subsp. pneumoniae]
SFCTSHTPEALYLMDGRKARPLMEMIGDKASLTYCSTLYRYNAKLHADETVPAGCVYEAPADKAA